MTFSSYFAAQEKANTQEGSCSSTNKVILCRPIDFFLALFQICFSSYLKITFFFWLRSVYIRVCSICIHFQRVFKNNRQLFLFTWLRCGHKIESLRYYKVFHKKFPTIGKRFQVRRTQRSKKVKK